MSLLAVKICICLQNLIKFTKNEFFYDVCFRLSFIYNDKEVESEKHGSI